MKQVLQHVRGRRLEVADVPAPGGRAGGVLVRVAASLISAGTERMVTDFASKSLLGKARERPDLVRQVFDKVRKDGLVPTAQAVLSRLEQPIPLGYSCAGTVVEAGRGAEAFGVGDAVACAGMGYASHADVVWVPKNLAVPCPAGVSLEDASYVTVGAIALQGVRVADVRLGDTVAVIGLGLLGQLAVQLLASAGCRAVGIDIDPAKVSLARELGAETAVARGDDVFGTVSRCTGGVGVDAVLVCAATDSNDPTELAGDICRDRGRVVMVGAVKMDVPRKVYYEKELELRMSRSYGPGRYDPAYEEQGHDYPIGYVRWTERRNMEEFLRLVALGRVSPSRLTTHRFAIEDASRAYDLIAGKSGEAFAGVVLTYPASHADGNGERLERAVTLRRAAVGDRGVRVGVIGAGNFARAVLLPRLAKHAQARLVGLVTSTGATAKGAGDRFGFAYAATDSQRVLDDASIDAVLIATRHGSHARLAARALRAGKAVFVEKPLAIDEEQLTEVLEAQAETGGLLAVGFNRRFSPLARVMRGAFAAGAPLAITYRINAGAIPASHWTHDPVDGGGRVIGEVCHFVDFCSFLTDALPAEVFAAKLGGSEGALGDCVALTVRYVNGSVATINYFTAGDKSFAKERIEAFGGGTTAVLDDFRVLTVSRGGRRLVTKRMAQAKGFDEELDAFLTAVRAGGPPPIDVASLAGTTRVTFAALGSLATGAPIPVD